MLMHQNVIFPIKFSWYCALFLETRLCGQLTNNITSCEAEPYFTTEKIHFFFSKIMHILRDLLKKPGGVHLHLDLLSRKLDLAVLTGFYEGKR